MTATADSVAEAAAQAERRRAILGELAEIGLNLARGVGAHAAAAMSAVNEKYAGDPTRAFATVSRCVRLTLAMDARNDGLILALRNGRVPAAWSATAISGAKLVPAPPARREPARVASDTSRERLVDREEEEAFLDLAFEAGVEAIRRELGVETTQAAALEPRRSAAARTADVHVGQISAGGTTRASLADVEIGLFNARDGAWGAIAGVTLTPPHPTPPPSVSASPPSAPSPSPSSRKPPPA